MLNNNGANTRGEFNDEHPAYTPEPGLIINRHCFNNEIYIYDRRRNAMVNIKTGENLTAFDGDTIIHAQNPCVFRGTEYIYVKTVNGKEGFMDAAKHIHNLKMFGKKILYIGKTLRVKEIKCTSLLLEEKDEKQTHAIIDNNDTELIFRIKIEPASLRHQRRGEEHRLEKVLEFNYPGNIGDTPYVFAKITPGDFRLVNADTLEKIYALDKHKHKHEIIGIYGDITKNGETYKQVQTHNGMAMIDLPTFKIKDF